MSGLDLDIAIQLLALMLGIGAIAGLLAGLLGVGGGIIVVPGLYYSLTRLGFDPAHTMHVAIGTSLGTIIPTAISSTRAHFKRGSIDLALLRGWAPAVLLGVALGSFFAAQISGLALTAVFAMIAMSIALFMALSNENTALSDRPPRPPVKFIVGGIIGFVSSLMGIGGATLSVPAMTLFRTPIRRAVGTSAALGLVIAVPGALAYVYNGWNVAGVPPYTVGFVNLLAIALIAPVTVFLAPQGARLAHSVPTEKLRRIFAVFLAFVSLEMFYEVWQTFFVRG